MTIAFPWSPAESTKSVDDGRSPTRRRALPISAHPRLIHLLSRSGSDIWRGQRSNVVLASRAKVIVSEQVLNGQPVAMCVQVGRDGFGPLL
jgi:hypothetical protein